MEKDNKERRNKVKKPEKDWRIQPTNRLKENRVEEIIQVFEFLRGCELQNYVRCTNSVYYYGIKNNSNTWFKKMILNKTSVCNKSSQE